MKTIFRSLCAFSAAVLLMAGCCNNSSKWVSGEYSRPYKVENGTIVTKVPERPAGQESALGLTAPKVPVVRVGFVGIRGRGAGAIERWTYIDGTRIVALCDYEQEVAERRQNILKEASSLLPSFTGDRKDTRNSVNGTTLTSSISQPTGSITSL